MLARHQFHQVSLDLFRIGLASETEPMRKSRDMRVDHDALIFAEGVAENHVRSLSADARQLLQFFHRVGNAPLVFRHDRRGRRANALRFVPKETVERIAFSNSLGFAFA